MGWLMARGLPARRDRILIRSAPMPESSPPFAPASAADGVAVGLIVSFSGAGRRTRLVRDRGDRPVSPFGHAGRSSRLYLMGSSLTITRGLNRWWIRLVWHRSLLFGAALMGLSPMLVAFG
jgi:hypothetical protein